MTTLNRKWTVEESEWVTSRDYFVLRREFTKEQTLGILAEISDCRHRVSPIREYHGYMTAPRESLLYY